MSDPILSVRDLSLELDGRRLVERLSFDLAPGEHLCLLGASGSGKSLIASALLGLQPRGARLSGSVRIAGHEVLGLAPARRPRAARTAMVFQDSLAALNPLSTVATHLLTPLRRHQGLKGEAARRRAAALLETVGLSTVERLLRACPAELSGGQRQRVCIALALACRAPLLIADEPTTALDLVTQAQVIASLRRYAKTAIPSPGMLFITHDLSVAAQLCQHALVIENGRAVECAPLHTLLAAPRHAYSRALVAAARASMVVVPPVDRRIGHSAPGARAVAAAAAVGER